MTKYQNWRGSVVRRMGEGWLMLVNIGESWWTLVRMIIGHVILVQAASEGSAQRNCHPRAHGDLNSE